MKENSPLLRGTVTYVDHDKGFVTIEYKSNNKKSTINHRYQTKEAAPKKGEKTEKPHHFRVGDELSFRTTLSDRGDRMVPVEVKFLYNTALQALIDKADQGETFIGYLKEANDRLFVKERDSYLFFPLEVSKWEAWPDPRSYNEPIPFRLIHTGNMKRLAAELLHPVLLPEYKKALQHFNKKSPIAAQVFHATPFAVYLNVVGDVVQAKIDLAKAGDEQLKQLKPGDTVQVRITYLSKSKIVVEKV